MSERQRETSHGKEIKGVGDKKRDYIIEGAGEDRGRGVMGARESYAVANHVRVILGESWK